MKAINATRGTGFRPIIYSTAAVFAAALALPASAQVPPPPVVPGAPTIISATATANLQAIVSFTPTPTSNNGGAAITGYTATCNSASHTVSGNEQWVGGPSLLVRNLRKGTTYTCSVTATNSAGTGPASAASNSVTPIGAPDAPTIGTATALDGRVRVTYTGPINIGGSPITRYVARCTATGSPAHVSMGTTDLRTAPDSPLAVMVSALNGRTYTCAVRADNLAGEGPYSAASSSAMPIGAPDAPTIGTATAVEGIGTAADRQLSGRVRVTYSAPSNTGGSPITRYVARCTATGSPSNVSMGTTDLRTAPDSPLAVMVSALNGRTYTCTVRADNLAGEGPYSTASNSVTPVAPGAPVAAVSPPGVPTNVSAKEGRGGEAIVTFSPPSNAGDAKLSYRAICGTAASGGVAGANVAEGRDSPLIVKGLTRGMVYICKVAARNSAGLGMDSKESNKVKPE